MNLPSNPSESFKRANPHLYSATKAEPIEIPSAKRIRQNPKPLMNKLEEEWLACLEQEHAGVTIWKQALRWRLGNGTWYKPDFVAHISTTHHDGLTCWEVKGPHAFRGGFENLKVAASLYPEVAWVLVWKENGQWKQQAVLP